MSTSKFDICSIPDYPVLKKLASALWKKEVTFHGAAVIVGSGFSRSAAYSGDRRKTLPLWTDLLSVLKSDLGYDHGLHPDPLVIAEEYSAYFGRQALQDLIEEQINDSAWAPGEMYHALLKLPWSEVLTTNWDTLLERASESVHERLYSVISKQEDLSSFRSPRIVKLHGTMGITRDLIFTQEDYRTYPQKYAAFVNLARQVFIENELCMLGFSGDDPNFLQWIGWVRDQLAGQSRRIYLVGSLNLSPSRRRYLESINVAPVDLYELVKDYENNDVKHRMATEIFLNELNNLKPINAWEWSLTSFSGATVSREKDGDKRALALAKNLEKRIGVLAAERDSYPGWLVCPRLLCDRLTLQVDSLNPNEEVLGHLSESSRAKFLYEVAWRYLTANDVVGLEMTKQMIKVIEVTRNNGINSKQKMEVALLILKSARWLEGVSPSIIESAKSVLEANASHWPDGLNHLHYYGAILARDEFDYPRMESLAEGIPEDDPVWMLRKAALLSEVGRFNEGENLIERAHRQLLDQHRVDRNSIFVLSRLAWSHWLMTQIERFRADKILEPPPPIYREAKCCPDVYLKKLVDRISSASNIYQNLQGVEPSFSPGRYRDRSHTIRFGTDSALPVVLDGLAWKVGLPVRWQESSFLVELASSLTSLERANEKQHLSLMIRASTNDSAKALKQTFSRIQVARLPKPTVDYLIAQCELAIKYLECQLSLSEVSRKRFLLDRMSVFLEVLSRLSVRVEPDQAKDLFKLGVSLGKKRSNQELQLFRSIGSLLENSKSAVPECQQQDLIRDALEFPLASELSSQHVDNWPNPVVDVPLDRPIDDVTGRRIDEIIGQIRLVSKLRVFSFERLISLYRNQSLSPQQEAALQQKIWGDESVGIEVPPETGLLSHGLLLLPSPDPDATMALVRKKLFESVSENVFEYELLRDILGAAQIRGSEVRPNCEQAKIYLEKLVLWRPKNDLFNLFSREHLIGELIGKVLARSIVPALSNGDLSKDQFLALCAFHREVPLTEAVIALVRFAAVNEEFSSDVERHIRSGLQGHTHNIVAYSSHAALKWAELTGTAEMEKLISRIVYLIESGRETGLSALLWTTLCLLKKNFLNNDQIEVLGGCLPMVFDGADYELVKHDDRKAVNVSIVRENCARIAVELCKISKTNSVELKGIIQKAREDALPEVRFAVASGHTKFARVD